MQTKSWIRAIPTHLSKSHIQAYYDEFCFIMNRLQSKKSIFHKTIEKIVDSNPIYHYQIKQMLNV